MGSLQGALPKLAVLGFALHDAEHLDMLKSCDGTRQGWRLNACALEAGTWVQGHAWPCKKRDFQPKRQH